MEPTPQIKLPVPYETTGKDSNPLKKIETKIKTLSKIGSEKIVHFIGSNEVQSMYYLYLFKKYKSKCFVHNKSITSSRILGLIIDIKQKYTEYETKKIENLLDTFSEKLVSCIKNPDTKIIIIPFSLKLENGVGHANVLIYRKNLNQIEHFEPHGKHFNTNSYTIINAIIDSWMRKFVSILNRKLNVSKEPQVNFIASNQVCPYIDGLQNLESRSYLTKLGLLFCLEYVFY